MTINSNFAIWFPRTIAVFAIATVLLGLPASAQPDNPNPGVVPPFSTTAYGEWSAKWFKWAWEPPPASSPVLDTTGSNCAVGQSGPVWFLAGTFFTSLPAPPPVIRHCTTSINHRLFPEKEY